MIRNFRARLQHSIILGIACGAFGGALVHAELPALYVIFEGGGPDQGPGPDMAANMVALKETFGKLRPGANRLVAYGVQQIPILTRSTACVAEEIGRALNSAEQTEIPIWLHLDPLYAWGSDREKRAEDAPEVKFWEQLEMREWSEFPAGEALPKHIPRFWFNWGAWCSPTAAVPAIGSPKFTAFAQHQLREGVLAPLTTRLAKWTREGREHLFAGINVGWEMHLPDYGRIGPQPPVAQYPSYLRGLKMKPETVGAQLGYASLHWQGWNETKLQAAAAEEGISREEKFRQLCYESIHDYLSGLARACIDAGLQRTRVYTHIVALATVRPPDTNAPPIWTAVNPYSTPGFTMDNKGGARYDLALLRKQLASAPGSAGSGFGVVESYFGLNGKTYVESAAKCQEEIEHLFHEGARVQAFYGCFPFHRRMPKEAVVAVQHWLAEDPH